MITSRGIHMSNTAYIPSNCKNIRITDINQLGEIAVTPNLKYNLELD